MITSPIPGKLHITWPLKSVEGTLVIDMDERQINIKVEGEKTINWFLELTAADNAKLPFTNIGPRRIDCRFEGMNYRITASEGSFSQPGGDKIFRISPEMNALRLNL
jgi:hypothetical protein